jgi:hypothetical protein
VAQPAHAAAAPETKHSRLAWRTWVPWALVVLGSLIVLVAALNVWVKRQALSTDNWTNSSAQLLENDQIRQALSVYLVNQVYANVDVSQQLQQRLPAQLDPIAPQIAVGLEQASIRVVDNLLGRPRIQKLWKEANRRAHQAFMNLLNGHDSRLVSTNGNVVLDLRPLLEKVVQELGFGDQALAKLPPDAAQITVLKGNQLQTARTSVKVVRVLSYVLLFLAIAIFAVAMWISRSRRSILLGAGIGVLVVGLLVLVVRRYLGNYLVDQLTNSPDAKGAVKASWAIETNLLRNVGVNGVIYGAAIIFAAWIAGPGRLARWCREKLAPTMRDRPVLVYGALTAVLAAILLTGPTDAQRVYPLLILFGFAYLGLEVLRRQTMREFPSEPAAAT